VASNATHEPALATARSNGTAPHIDLVPCANEAEWDALLAQRIDATVFHRMFWLRLIAKRFKADLKPYVVMADGAVAGLFPAFVYRRGWFRVAVSPPPQTGTPYLGPLVAPELQAAVLEAFTRQMKTARVSYIEIRFPPHVTEVPRGFQVESRGTHMLDLRPGEDQLWNAALNSGCRRAVRKATAAGVTISEGDLSAHLDQYFAMAVDVFAKSKRPPVLGRDDYAALAEVAGKGGPVKVLFAWHEGRLVAGGIFPFDEQAIYYLDGVSDPGGLQVRPNNLLHWEVIRWACAHGLVRYDMIGAGIESINRFKRGFGAVQVSYTYAYRSLDFLTTAARTTYALLAPAGRAVQYAAQRLSKRDTESVQ